MTFASVNDMSVGLEWVFNGMIVLGLYCLAFAIIALVMVLTTAVLRIIVQKRETPTLLDHFEKRLRDPKINMCTRQGEHVCRVNGPCNGWPRV